MTVLLNDQLPERLRRRLERPLPGRRAQRRMTTELAYGRHFGPPACNARAAAVLILIYRDHKDWCLPLTLRPEHMVDHAGQVSFPGGVTERGETPEKCALREFTEELGATCENMTLLGRLTPLYVFASNFWVTPCVAAADVCPVFRPNPDEVARVLVCELSQMLRPEGRGAHRIQRRGIDFQTHHLRCGDDRVWGATAMILSEFIQVVIDACATPPSP